jgi:hypothetical protein
MEVQLSKDMHKLLPIRKCESQTGKNGLYNLRIFHGKFKFTKTIQMAYE